MMTCLNTSDSLTTMFLIHQPNLSVQGWMMLLQGNNRCFHGLQGQIWPISKCRIISFRCDSQIKCQFVRTWVLCLSCINSDDCGLIVWGQKVRGHRVRGCPEISWAGCWSLNSSYYITNLCAGMRGRACQWVWMWVTELSVSSNKVTTFLKSFPQLRSMFSYYFVAVNCSWSLLNQQQEARWLAVDWVEQMKNKENFLVFHLHISLILLSFAKSECVKP